MRAHKQIESVTSQVAKILHEERTERQLSMMVVAQRSGLSQPAVSLIERGDRKPTLDTLLRLSFALGVDFVEILRRAQRRAVRCKDK